MGVVRSRLAELPAAVGATARLLASTRFIQNRGVADEEDPPLRERAPFSPPGAAGAAASTTAGGDGPPDPSGSERGSSRDCFGGDGDGDNDISPDAVRREEPQRKNYRSPRRAAMFRPTTTVASEVVVQRLSRRPETGKFHFS